MNNKILAKKLVRIAKELIADRTGLIDMEKVQGLLRSKMREKKDVDGPRLVRYDYFADNNTIDVQDLVGKIYKTGGLHRGKLWGDKAGGKYYVWALSGTCGPYSDGTIEIISKDGKSVWYVITQCSMQSD